MQCFNLKEKKNTLFENRKTLQSQEADRRTHPAQVPERAANTAKYFEHVGSQSVNQY